MIIAVLSGFLFALSIPLWGNFLKKYASLWVSALPILLFTYFLSLIPQVGQQGIMFSYAWIPSYGINLNFYLDGLSLLFTLLITGIGALVFIYTSAYLKDHEYLDRFYGFLAFFMASMLGLVLSDNVISLFVFWELTSISSFFLIGFNNQDEDSRKSALVALGITGLGGLFLLAAAIGF